MDLSPKLNELLARIISYFIWDILKIEVYNVQYVLPSAPPAVTWGEEKFPGTRFAAKVANEATCV